MPRLWIKRIALLVLVAAAAWGALDPWARSSVAAAYRQVLVWLHLEAESDAGLYWCSMHPEIRRVGPGSCPLCNMALIPLGQKMEGDPGVLQLTDRQIQQGGVRTGVVRGRDLVREIDATARMETNHDRRATITCWVPGKNRIVKLHRNYTGERVTKGQTLVELYSPTIATTLEEYRLARKELATARSAGGGDGAPRAQEARLVADSVRQRLLALGLTVEQIERLSGKPTGSVMQTIPILAPFAGTLLAPAQVKEGGYVTEGSVLFQLADLTTLWLFVDLYEHELPLVRIDQKVVISTRARPGKPFEGTVRFVEPFVQEKSRTVRVRVDVDNRDGSLMPGMFARVKIESHLAGVLAVPESAVLQTGRRSVVILAEGGGRYRPRIVRLGRRFLYPARPPGDPGRQRMAAHDRYHEVEAGLRDGDRVVLAGAFLLNAEAQFQGIVKKMMAEADAAEKAAPPPPLARPVKRELERALDRYLEAAAALVQNRPGAFRDPARRAAVHLEQALSQLGSAHPAAALLRRMAGAARSVGAVAAGDLKRARQGFGAWSKEVVAFLRDHDPGPVERGELYLFQCPMAPEPYGFGMWVQKEARMANPYMADHPAMTYTCGMKAGLR